jgi:hypothetical protein
MGSSFLRVLHVIHETGVLISFTGTRQTQRKGGEGEKCTGETWPRRRCLRRRGREAAANVRAGERGRRRSPWLWPRPASYARRRGITLPWAGAAWPHAGEPCAHAPVSRLTLCASRASTAAILASSSYPHRPALSAVLARRATTQPPPLVYEACATERGCAHPMFHDLCQRGRATEAVRVVNAVRGQPRRWCAPTLERGRGKRQGY